MSKSLKTSILAISAISGTIIGVGLFSLPYITMKVGIWTMLAYFLVLGAIVTIIHMLFGKVSLATPDFLRLPSFAEIHLGQWGKKVAFFSTVFGSIGGILSYIIVGGEFSTALFSPVFGGSALIYTFIYFALGALLIYFGIGAIAKVEFWALILLFAILAFIFFYAQFQSVFKIENIFAAFPEPGNWFLPYGAILYSLWGATFVPEIEEMMGENKKLLKIVLPIATLIPLLVYIFFVFLILGISGSKTTESALTGLGNFLGGPTVALALFFGILTTFTSFIAVGLTLKRVLCYDFKLKEKLAWFISCFVPLSLFLFGIKHFIPLVSFLGGVLLGIEGILIILMYQKIASKKAKFFTYPLILVFIFGVVYEIMYFVK